MLYGVGGTAFGLAIRYIGFSLTYAIAIGISAVIGTLVPEILAGTLLQKLGEAGGNWVVLAMATGIVGIGFTGFAGRLKEQDLQSSDSPSEFKATLGLIIAFVAGVLSAVYGISLSEGAPIADVAEAHGAGVHKGLIVYMFSNPGAFITTAAYCIWLHSKHKTAGELVKLPAGPEEGSLRANFALAILTGCLWYGQFFFYNLGHVRMGNFEFTSWAIHMLMLVLISGIIGLMLREWRNCRPLTHTMIAVGLVVLSAAVLMMAYGNKIGSDAANAAAAPTTEIVE
jgi:L-rhamnose-H+ transport protein